jgi:hypothetical protein
MKKLIIMDLDQIRSDLVSGTLDEKHECMGYDSIPPLGPISRRPRIVDPVQTRNARINGEE